MLSIFPTLFSYALVVPFVFRIVVGAIFIYLGYKRFSASNSASEETKSLKSWIFIFLEMVGGLMLIAGIYTQVVSIIFSAILLTALTGNYKFASAVETKKETLLLLLLITLSLLFLGAGFYAFDLPL